jgi:hypothetical protein
MMEKSIGLDLTCVRRGKGNAPVVRCYGRGVRK